MKCTFNFEKSVKSTILKVQTTKTGRSDQPIQKEHLTRFNIHLGFSKTQKKRKKQQQETFSICTEKLQKQNYTAWKIAKLSTLTNHIHHCAKSLSQCNKIGKRKKHTACERHKTTPICRQHGYLHIKSQDYLPKTTANK